jgi:hypothetical protein
MNMTIGTNEKERDRERERERERKKERKKEKEKERNQLEELLWVVQLSSKSTL